MSEVAAHIPRRPATDATIAPRRVLAGAGIALYAAGCGALVAFAPAIGAAAALGPLAVWLMLRGAEVRGETGRRVLALVAWLLLLVAAVPWETADIGETGEVTGSGADIAKLGMILLAALLGVFSGARWRQPWVLVALVAYAAFAAAGAFLGPDEQSSLLRSARYAFLVIVLGWVARRFSTRRTATLLFYTGAAIALTAVAANVAGISPLEKGRLTGWMPPTHPNTLGLVTATALASAAVLWTRNQIRAVPLVAGVAIATVALILTESRTSLLALVIALVVIGVLQLRVRAIALMAGLVGVLLTVVLLQLFTQDSPITSFLTRGGTTTATATVEARLSGWEAVAEANPDLPTKAFGRGLAAKDVDVDLPYTREGTLDGSWPAAYLSGGVMGVLALAVAVFGAMFAALRRRDPLAISVGVLAIVVSVNEIVFSEVSMGLVLFVSAIVAGASASSEVEAAHGFDQRPGSAASRVSTSSRGLARESSSITR